jgi:tetratricopeptide (TPR) repeat protein
MNNVNKKTLLTITIFLAMNAGNVFGIASEFKTVNDVKMALNYRYTDRSTWQSVDQLIPYLCEITQNADDQFEKDEDMLHAMAVASFHLIWNTQDFVFAHKLINYLFYKEYRCTPLLHYFKGKLFSFEQKFDAALNCFNMINVSLISTKEEQAELHDMLLAIGSLTSNDPQGIENDLLKVITVNDTANILLAQGKAEKAIQAFEHALAMQKNAYKTTMHANVAYTLRCLAQAYAEQGNLNIAKEKFQQALDMCNVIYHDANHPEIAAIRKSLQDLSM